MQVINYAVKVEFERDARMKTKYIEFELLNAHRPDELKLRSRYLSLYWVSGNNGEFRKAS